MNRVKGVVGLLFLVVLGFGCQTRSILQPEPTLVMGEKSVNEVKEGILRGLQIRRWKVVGDKEGEIIAQLVVRSHTAKVRIPYTDKKYTIEYLDSTNLKHNPSAGTIHRSYNRWIKNLDLTIQQNM